MKTTETLTAGTHGTTTRWYAWDGKNRVLMVERTDGVMTQTPTGDEFATFAQVEDFVGRLNGCED